MLVRVHEAFVEQPFRASAFSLIAIEVLFAVITLAFTEFSQHWQIAVYQIAGIAAIVLAMKRRDAEAPGDRFLMFTGAVAAILFLYAFVTPLGYLALVAWGIVVLVSVVT